MEPCKTFARAEELSLLGGFHRPVLWPKGAAGEAFPKILKTRSMLSDSSINFQRLAP
jgi:hypothetical protein